MSINEPFIVRCHGLGLLRSGDRSNLRLGEHSPIQAEALPSPQSGLFLPVTNKKKHIYTSTLMWLRNLQILRTNNCVKYGQGEGESPKFPKFHARFVTSQLLFRKLTLDVV